MSRHPIAEYALLSDCHSAALVHRSGSIDWLGFPRYDPNDSLDQLKDGSYVLAVGQSPLVVFLITHQLERSDGPTKTLVAIGNWRDGVGLGSRRVQR
jgi:hypothetical protein